MRADGRGFTMNPRLVEPGFASCRYTLAAPLVPVRTSTATTRRSESDDMCSKEDIWMDREPQARRPTQPNTLTCVEGKPGLDYASRRCQDGLRPRRLTSAKGRLMFNVSTSQSNDDVRSTRSASANAASHPGPSSGRLDDI